jgi:hypothetical protein
LHELGYVEGLTVRFEVRSAQNDLGFTSPQLLLLRADDVIQ